MNKTIVKFAVIVAAAVASVVATVGTASAGGYGYHHHGPGYGGHHGRPHWRPLPYRTCLPMHAVDKARWSGLRRAHVERISHNRVVIAGYRHHGYDRMVFANRAGCPLIRY